MRHDHLSEYRERAEREIKCNIVTGLQGELLCHLSLYGQKWHKGQENVGGWENLCVTSLKKRGKGRTGGKDERDRFFNVSYFHGNLIIS